MTASDLPPKQFWRKIAFPFQLLLFWLSVFFAFRFLFFIFYYSRFEGSFGHRLLAFPAALRLDLTMAAYLSTLPFLFWLIYFFTEKKILDKINRVYHYLFIPLIILILVSNLGLYGSWGTLLNRRLLLYLEKPGEIAHFIDTWKLFALPVIIFLFSWLAIKLKNKMVYFERGNVQLYKKIAFPLVLPLLFLFIRGGISTIPINESAACYSGTVANNHLAINPVFYFLHSASEYFYVSDKYQFYEAKEAQLNVDEFLNADFAGCDTLLTTTRPNIVIILLESWTADILESTGELKGVAPFTDSLIQQSLFFSQAYGSGYRTDQGLISVLSGYPSQPDNTIISYPAKSESLPTLSDVMKKENYNLSFFYGGDVSFANMKNYLQQHSFEKIFDKSAFSSSEQNSKWGAHDGPVFDKQISFLNSEKKPFFSCVLTLSTHEPFEVPMETPFNGSTEHEKFKKSAWYTDQCLKNYFKTAQQQSWYNNTIFVLVADHGHYLPIQRDMNKPESKRITMFITGNTLHPSQKGRTIAKPVAQHDIAATLLSAMKLDRSAFKWSRDIFCENTFGYYCNENAVGLITEQGNYLYFFDTKSSTGNSKLEKFTKSYLQLTYKDFVDR